jgi:hypothetical protein
MGNDGSVGCGLVRQGDLLLIPVGAVPERARSLGSGRLVLLEGEATGHAHVVDDERASLHTLGIGGTRYLSVAGDAPVLLVHEEHAPLSLPPAVYEVRRQREYVPQQRSRSGSRWVAD